MLEPDERSLLHETLRPPEGFELDEAIGTTFSLDLLTLLSVPLAFTMFDWEDRDGRPTRDPVLLLEALSRHMARITVFAQAGRTSAPNRHNPLFAYLEESVVEVTAPQADGVFHPKMWALRFTGPDGAVRYRLVCLTRNLTEDRSWDLSAVLEGNLRDRQRAIAASRPLGDFIAALPGLAIRDVAPAVRERVERMAAELRRVEWQPEDPFEACDLHPLGISGYKRDPTLVETTQGLAISPFVSPGQVEMWSEPTATLISRPEELDRIPRKLLAGFKEVLVLRAEAARSAEDADAGGSEGLSGLHAKCYVMDHGWDTSVFVGSANLTDAAFAGRNVEFLLELRGKKSKLGVSSFLDGDGGGTSLRSLLEPYAGSAEPLQVDAIAEELERLVDGLRILLAKIPLRLTAAFRDGGADPEFTLRVPGGVPELPAECQVRVWPITLPEHPAARSLARSSVEVAFGKVAYSALTTFLGVSVSARREGRVAEGRFVLNLPLDGAPADRRQAVLRGILDDPEKVMRFLQFLLGEDDAVPGEATSAGRGSGGDEGRNAGGFALLESLLRALTRDPSRLDHVEALLKELDANGDASTAVPEGLMDIWPAIWAARQELPR